MSLAIDRARVVGPSGDTSTSGSSWFWPLLVVGVGGFVAYDYFKGNLSVHRNPEPLAPFESTVSMDDYDRLWRRLGRKPTHRELLELHAEGRRRQAECKNTRRRA